MLRTLISCFVVGIMFFDSPPCWGDSSVPATIEVLGVKLAIGMSKADAFAPYSAYRVLCVGGSGVAPECDSWLINSNKRPDTAFANLYFRNGKLIQVRKYWDRGYQDTHPEKFVSTLHSILAQYAGARSTSMTVSTSETSEGGLTQINIFFSKDNRIVEVGYVEGQRDQNGRKFPPVVMTSEILE